MVEGALDVQRKQQLGELALEALFPGEEKVARHLHGNGTATLGTLPGPGIADGRPPDAHEIDALVLEKAAVLGGQKGIHQRRRDLIEGNRAAALDAELRHESAIGTVHAQGLL